jgi:hypothetical protein
MREPDLKGVDQTEREMLMGGGDLANYAEATKFGAYFSGKQNEYVNLSATGFIHTAYSKAVLLSLGWVDNIQADGEAASAPALVIQVLEVNSPTANDVPDDYDIVEIISTPLQMMAVGSNSAVFCYQDPGTLQVQPDYRKMKRTRIIVQ